MGETAFATADDLINGIMGGRVPRQVRLFAAQGLLPVSREDLLRLQLVLTADPDPDLAHQAEASVVEVPVSVIRNWLEHDQDIAPIELDLLTRIRADEEIWIAVARHPKVSDQTLYVLAAHGLEAVQDVIVTNQVRIFGHLEILDGLRSNPKVTPVTLRRVREFEEEFIEKAAALAEREVLSDDDARGPSIEEALEALRAIGAAIPKEDFLPYLTPSDPQVEEQASKKLSVHGRLLKMSVRDKVVCAIRGTREERGILINSRSRLVMRAVLACPKLTDGEIEKFAASKSVSDEVIRAIAENHKWVRLYPVVLALVQNPKAPVRQSIQFLSRLSAKDLNRVARDRNVNPIVRRQARSRLESSRR